MTGPDRAYHRGHWTVLLDRRAALALTGLLAALLGACGGDETVSAKDGATAEDTATGLDATTDAGTDASAADVPPDSVPVDVVVPDIAQPDVPQPVGLWTQIVLPGGQDRSLHGVWTDGTTRVVAVGSGGAVVGYDGLKWSFLAQDQFPTLNAVTGTPGAATTIAVGMNGTIVQAKGVGGQIGKVWGPPGGCLKPADCNDNDVCTTDVCEAGTCQHGPSGAAGCCGGPTYFDSFDKGLGNWTISDLHSASGQGGVVWTAAAMTGKDGKLRVASPPKAAYFGRTDAPCPGDPAAFCPSLDNGKVVGSTMLSPEIAVPKAAKVALTFKLFLDGAPAHQMRLSVVSPVVGKKIVWDKAKVAPNGSTGGAFALQSADLTEFAGQKIRLELMYNTLNAFTNQGEGAFVDDLLLATTCAPGTTSGKVLTQATWFGTWAAADDDAWAVGTDGAVARWDGKQWSLVSGGKTKEYHGLGGVAGGAAFVVGDQGLVATLGPGGPGAVASPPAGTLRAVAVTKGQDGAADHAVAVGDNSTVLELQDGAWQVVSFPQPFLALRGVAAVGDGSYLAVGGNQIATRPAGPAGKWQLAATFPAQALAVTTAPGGKAWAVGGFGTVAEKTGESWNAEQGKLGFDNLWSVHANSATDVWAVGDNAATWHFDGQGWQKVPAATSLHLRAVWGAGPNEVFAAGLSGSLMHWDGSAWSNMQSPVGADFEALWGTGPEDVYAAGSGGVVMRWNGKTWQVIAQPVTHTLRAVWGSGKNDVWAVGEQGAIYHSTGAGWSFVPIEPFDTGEDKPYEVKTTLLAVWGSGPDDVWAAGAPDFNGRGTLVHWDGKTWQYQPAMMGETRVFRAIWGWGKDKVLFAGTQGMVWYWDGKEYEELHPGTIATLFGIARYGKDALLVGDIGTVLRFTPLK